MFDGSDMPQPTPTISDISQHQQERRRRPRIPFNATSVITESGSSQIVVAQTSELSRFGCFVQTVKPYPKGTSVHIEMSEGGTTFVASGAVAFVSSEGMGVVFSVVEPDCQAILEAWLSRIARKSTRYSIGATSEVKQLGSRNEYVLSTRDLSAGDCFVTTRTPLPRGARIQVRIKHGSDEFTAVARVTDNVTPQGMGLEFLDVQPKDRAVLEKWLADEQGRRQS